MTTPPSRLPIGIIAGPTASGKSALAVAIARSCNGVIINADSMQVYQEIPRLSAQPPLPAQENIPHMLYGYISGKESYSVAAWAKDAIAAIRTCHTTGKFPILVGGTGMYLRALMEGLADIPDIPSSIREAVETAHHKEGIASLYAALQQEDPLMASKLSATDSQRIKRALMVKRGTQQSLEEFIEKQRPYFHSDNWRILAILPPRNLLYQRCDLRFDAMLTSGAIEEAERLKDAQWNHSLPMMKVLGLSPLIDYLQRKLPYPEAIEKAKQMTRNYAKRQYTWFRNQLHSGYFLLDFPDKNKDIQLLQEYFTN